MTVAIHVNGLCVWRTGSASRKLAMQLIGLALAGTTLPSSAQLRLDVLPETALLAPRESYASNSSVVPAVPSARQFSGALPSDSTWLGTAVQLEAPRVTSTGQYTRPKFHVGVPSESMRGFLNSAGFSADKCQLPMVRARTKSNGDGDINGTLWLYARCTFR